MGHMTKEQIEELREMQFHFCKSKHYLYEKAKEIYSWEQNHLGAGNEKIPEFYELENVDFSPENHDGEICFHLRNRRNQESKMLYIEESKFYTDDWKQS